MPIMVSYNIACKKKQPTFYENIEMVRMNSPWYTESELIEAFKTVKQKKFVDVNLKIRTKDKVTDHDFEKLLNLIGKHNIDWVGISNVEETKTYDTIRKLLGNDTTKICAKIETKKGFENRFSIIKVYDGVMVDVEDLASEVGWSDASKYKKMIYEACEKVKKTHFRLSGVLFDCVDYEKVVYTYGAWDLLHPGHIKILEKAKSYGEKLIVGVVRDKAIKELKGEDRPVQNEMDRLFIVSNLKCVDEAVIQEDYNPVPNLEKFNPDILVKGNDWDYIPGEEWIKEKGRKLIKPQYSSGWSTSETVKKIRKE